MAIATRVEQAVYEYLEEYRRLSTLTESEERYRLMVGNSNAALPDGPLSRSPERNPVEEVIFHRISRTVDRPWTNREARAFDLLSMLAPNGIAANITTGNVGLAPGNVVLAPPTPPAPPLPPPPKIHVRVYRDSPMLSYRGNEWYVECQLNGVSKDLCDITTLKSFMLKKDAARLPKGTRHGTLHYIRIALNGGMDPNIIANALKAWLASTVAQPTEARVDYTLNEDTASLLNMLPATLEVGGIAYRLIPAGGVDLRPLVSRTRTKVIEASKAEGDRIKRQATEDGKIAVRSAEREAARIRQEAEAAKAAMRNYPPEWLLKLAMNSSRPIRKGMYGWEIGISCLMKVEQIRLSINSWNKVLLWKPLRTREMGGIYWSMNRLQLWVPVADLASGAYSLGMVHSNGPHTTTHIHTSKTCMSLQGLPADIMSDTNLKALEAAISRGMEVVNLSSPLDRDTTRYHPVFLAQLPPVVVKQLNGEINDPNNYRLSEKAFKERVPDFTWDDTMTYVEEAKQTFTLPASASATPATPVVVNYDGTPVIPATIGPPEEVTEEVEGDDGAGDEEEDGDRVVRALDGLTRETTGETER